ncbi:MAG: type III-B CRISPR module-associated Cmr3 family protein [Methylococcales bacterium]
MTGAARVSLNDSIGRVGADGRMARYLDITDWPACPEHLLGLLVPVVPGDLVRGLLATPAVFEEGWRPGWLNWNDGDKAWCGTPESLPGWEFKLIAAAIDCYQPYSGWAMRDSKRGKRGARAIRRMVPAGSVFWFQVVRKGTESLSRAWMKSACEDP